MNIFILDKDPIKAAAYHCDKHVVKMILESVQILSTVSGYGYKPTHKNHPCTLWVGESMENYIWLCELVIALHDEYQKRYGVEKVYKAYLVFKSMPFPDLPSVGLTAFRFVMPEQYAKGDIVNAYRNYYKTEKTFATWKNGKPEWL